MTRWGLFLLAAAGLFTALSLLNITLLTATALIVGALVAHYGYQAAMQNAWLSSGLSDDCHRARDTAASVWANLGARYSGLRKAAARLTVPPSITDRDTAPAALGVAATAGPAIPTWEVTVARSADGGERLRRRQQMTPRDRAVQPGVAALV